MKTFNLKLSTWFIACLYLLGFFVSTSIAYADGLFEYRYLRTIKEISKVNEKEFNVFLNSLKDKHLAELAVGFNLVDIKKQGLNSDGTINNVAQVLASLGGREEVKLKIKKELIWLYSSLATYFFKENQVPYHDMVLYCCKEQGIKESEYQNLTTFQAEQLLIKKAVADQWDKLTIEQREKVIKNSELDRLSENQKRAMIAESGLRLISIVSTTAYFTGFAFYTTMSSIMFATASALGVALPISAYLTASTAVGILTGPIGWAALTMAGIGTTLVSTGANPDRLTQRVMVIHMLKAKSIK